MNYWIIEHEHNTYKAKADTFLDACVKLNIDPSKSIVKEVRS